MLAFVRNFVITVVIGSAMLLQGPDGGIHDLVGNSWGLKVALMFGLGLILNYRKLRTLCRLLEGMLGLRTVNALSDAALSPATA